MWLLAEHRRTTARRDAALATRVRECLQAALARHAPGTAVWVYGSLVKSGRFREWSDVDLAFETLPAGTSLEYLQSVLSDEIGREVDVCLLDRTRLRPVSGAPGRLRALTSWVDPCTFMRWFRFSGRASEMKV